MSLVSNNNFLLASSCDSRGQEIPNPLTSHTVRVAKQMLTVQNSRRQNEEITMSDRPTESKRLLSRVIAERACELKYEHLSSAAIQAAKLFWLDSIGCALGGTQQDNARILLRHYCAMSGGKGNVNAFTGPVFVTIDHGDVLVRRAPPESNVLNLQLR